METLLEYASSRHYCEGSYSPGQVRAAISTLPNLLGVVQKAIYPASVSALSGVVEEL